MDVDLEKIGVVSYAVLKVYTARENKKKNEERLKQLEKDIAEIKRILSELKIAS